MFAALATFSNFFLGSVLHKVFEFPVMMDRQQLEEEFGITPYPIKAPDYHKRGRVKSSTMRRRLPEAVVEAPISVVEPPPRPRVQQVLEDAIFTSARRLPGETTTREHKGDGSKPVKKMEKAPIFHQRGSVLMTEDSKPKTSNTLTAGRVKKTKESTTHKLQKQETVRAQEVLAGAIFSAGRRLPEDDKRKESKKNVMERDQGDEKLIPVTGLPDEDATKQVQEQQPTDKVQLLGAETPSGKVEKRKDPVYKKRYKK
jgi:hypothetical protein